MEFHPVDPAHPDSLPEGWYVEEWLFDMPLFLTKNHRWSLLFQTNRFSWNGNWFARIELGRSGR